MKTILLFALALAASTPTAFGQSFSKRTPQAAGERKILQLEQEWMGAMRRRDEATLNRLVAPDFSLDGLASFDEESPRPPVPRGAWMDNALHNLRVESISFVKTRVRVFRETATVQAIFTWQGAFRGEPFADTLVLIDIWARRSGQWQVVSRLVGEGKKSAAAQ